MKIILDANVLVSSLFGGTPRFAVLQAFEESVYISPRIEAEFQSLGAKLSRRLPPDKFRTWTHVFLPSVLGRCERLAVRRKVDSSLSLFFSAKDVVQCEGMMEVAGISE